MLDREEFQHMENDFKSGKVTADTFSDSGAALLIQAQFRGHKVRKAIRNKHKHKEHGPNKHHRTSTDATDEAK